MSKRFELRDQRYRVKVMKADQSPKGAQFDSPAHRAGVMPISPAKPCKGGIWSYFAPSGLTLMVGIFPGPMAQAIELRAFGACRADIRDGDNIG